MGLGNFGSALGTHRVKNFSPYDVTFHDTLATLGIGGGLPIFLMEGIRKSLKIPVNARTENTVEKWTYLGKIFLYFMHLKSQTIQLNNLQR